MKVFEVLKILEANGWEWIRSRGSHNQFKHRVTGEVRTFAFHSRKEEVSPIKLKKIFKDFGITLK